MVAIAVIRIGRRRTGPARRITSAASMFGSRERTSFA
jgi:hypothetical protein